MFFILLKKPLFFRGVNGSFDIEVRVIYELFKNMFEAPNIRYFRNFQSTLADEFKTLKGGYWEIFVLKIGLLEDSEVVKSELLMKFLRRLGKVFSKCFGHLSAYF